MKTPYKIPADIHDRVLGLMCDLVNATTAKDEVLTEVYFEQLREFCEEQTAGGRGSGFLWEALADVTEEPGQRLIYYRRALSWAHRNSEPTETILQEMAQLGHGVNG